MAMFDALIGELAGKFGLGAQADPLVRELLQTITGGQGGLAGFLNRLRASGLGSQVESWVGGNSTAALPQSSVEAALGGSVVNGIASRLGLGAGVVSPALGYALPKVVGLLTPGGSVPQSLPAEVQGFLGSGERLGAHPVEQVRPVHEQVRPLHVSVLPDPRTHVHRWGIPAAIALGLAALAWYLVPSGPRAPVSLPPAPVQTAAVQPARSWLWLSDDNAVLRYSGQVRDEATGNSITDALTTAFGADKVNGIIAVNPAAAPVPWAGKLGAALDNLKVSGLQTLFTGDSVNVGGLASDVDRNKLASALQSALGGGVAFGTLADRVADLGKDTTTSASAALNSLPANFSASDLTKALNLSTVNFPAGAAEVPAATGALLRQAAARVQQLPAGTLIEIAGYADSASDPAANMSLSQERADTVRNMLVQAGVDPSKLVAKGYGNATNGRSGNSRIEYHVSKA